MTHKIGRNEPCPCGSGNKYKKCCLSEHETQKRVHQVSQNVPTESMYSETSASSISPNLSPYAIAKMSEPGSPSGIAAQNVLGDACRLNDSWYPSKLRNLSSEQIIAHLGQLGIAFDQALFVGAAEEHCSAWDTASTIWPEQINSGDNETADFSGLAACILWERYYEQGILTRPSAEMIDDWMQQGYDFSCADQAEDAVHIWFKVWHALQEMFDLSAMSISDIDSGLGGTQSVFNWCQDFETELINASFKNPDIAARGAGYLSGFIDFFGDEAALIDNFIMAYGELCCRSGEQEKGEAVMRQLIEKHPDKAIGYIGLAMAFEIKGKNSADSFMTERLEVLERARDYPVTDGKDWDLALRIKELRKLPHKTNH